MTKAVTRSDLVNQGLSLDEAAIMEIERLRSEGEIGSGYKTVAQCYVCCEVESKDLVNKLIAAGLTNREIAAACAGINARRGADAKDGRVISARNIWQHKRTHFNVDAPAQAVYRHILERRAEEANIDHVNGMAHAITPYAVLETIMTKGYVAATDPDVFISPMQGASAAIKLHEMTSRDASQRQMAEVLATMNRIIMAAQRYVPADKQEAFVAEVEGRTAEIQQAISERVELDDEERKVRTFQTPVKSDERDVL